VTNQQPVGGGGNFDGDFVQDVEEITVTAHSCATGAGVALVEPHGYPATGTGAHAGRNAGALGRGDCPATLHCGYGATDATPGACAPVCGPHYALDNLGFDDATKDTVCGGTPAGLADAASFTPLPLLRKAVCIGDPCDATVVTPPWGSLGTCAGQYLLRAGIPPEPAPLAG